MNRFTITGTAVALDADGLANDIAYAGGGYVLAANSAADSLAHEITILGNAATNHSGKTFTITGTGPNGEPLTEDIAGPNGIATVTSTKSFLTVTSVTVSATTGADTFDIGWNANTVSPWEYIDRLGQWPAAGMAFDCIKGTGSPNYSVQYTLDGGVTAFTHADVTGETTSQAGTILTPVQAVRIKWTVAGQVTMHGLF